MCYNKDRLSSIVLSFYKCKFNVKGETVIFPSNNDERVQTCSNINLNTGTFRVKFNS